MGLRTVLTRLGAEPRPSWRRCSRDSRAIFLLVRSWRLFPGCAQILKSIHFLFPRAANTQSSNAPLYVRREVVQN